MTHSASVAAPAPRPRWEAWTASAAGSLVGSSVRAVLLFAVLSVLPWALGFSNLRSVAVGIVTALVGTLLASREAPEDRPLLLAILAVGYAVRLASLMALTWLQAGLAGLVLSPDGQTYLRIAQAMAEGRFVLLEHPALGLGGYDVAHYYLFAGSLLVLGGGLFSVQLVNSALGALTGCLLFSWGRQVVPRLAVPLGVVVALHPSLIALSSVNLLKDPSVIFFSVAAIWAVAGILEARSWRSLTTFTVLSLVAITYLRLGRFYVTAFLEVAFVVVWAAFVLRRVRIASYKPLRATLALLLVVVGSESVAMALGWPIGPRQVYLNVQNVLETPVALTYAPGLLATASAPHGGAGASANVPAESHKAGTKRPSPGLFATASAPHGGPGTSANVPAESREARTKTSSPGVQTSGPWLESGIAGRAVITASNFVRRLYGPFVWIPPPTWDAAFLLQADYLLYPGMLIWYALLPFVAIGLTLEAWRTATGVERRFPVALLCVFLLIYAAQFFILNLSHRQRDATLPFLLVFGFLGICWARGLPRWKLAYAAYWLALVLLALGHTLARSHLQAP